VVPGSTYSARRTCTTRTSAYDSEFDSITISECSRTIPHCIYSYLSAGYEWSWMISQSLMVYAPQIIFTQRSHWGPFFWHPLSGHFFGVLGLLLAAYKIKLNIIGVGMWVISPSWINSGMWLCDAFDMKIHEIWRISSQQLSWNPMIEWKLLWR